MVQTTTWAPPKVAPRRLLSPPGSAKRAKGGWKTWQLVAVAVGAVMLGDAAGATNKTTKLETAQAELVTAKAKAADDVAAANKRAADALAAAQAKVDRVDAARKTSLDERSAALDARSAELDKRDAAVSAKEMAKKASTFGAGTFEVGFDIQAGTYAAPGGSGDCYWEKLNAQNGIIDNYRRQGPAVVTIDAAVKFFSTYGCGHWTKR
jgi:multidrug efflux pump subunit AcrA (membrane-fusion protein)